MSLLVASWLMHVAPKNIKFWKPMCRYGNHCDVKCTGKHSYGISMQTFQKDLSSRRQWISWLHCTNTVLCCMGTPFYSWIFYPVTYSLKKQEGIDSWCLLLKTILFLVQQHKVASQTPEVIWNKLMFFKFNFSSQNIIAVIILTATLHTRFNIICIGTC